MSNSIVVKLGGTAATEYTAVASLARELAALSPSGLIVHGGGKEVSALSERLGHVPLFENGIRMTSDAEMDIVEMVLSGLANKRLVRILLGAGVPAVGLSGSDGGMITGVAVADSTGSPSRTGRVVGVDPSPLQAVWAAGFLPVVAPPSMSSAGISLNINADDVALAVAGAVEAAALVFLSDVKGVQIAGAVVHSLSAVGAERAISTGEISGGMIPKVHNALTALEHGVKRVVIGEYGGPGDLERLLDGVSGTSIRNKGGDQ